LSPPRLLLLLLPKALRRRRRDTSRRMSLRLAVLLPPLPETTRLRSPPGPRATTISASALKAAAKALPSVAVPAASARGLLVGRSNWLAARAAATAATAAADASDETAFLVLAVVAPALGLSAVGKRRWRGNGKLMASWSAGRAYGASRR